MRVLAVGNLYPPHHFGGYELVWRGAMRHLENAGHELRVLASDLRTDSTEVDPPYIRRELLSGWRDHGFPALGVRGRIALERHNGAVLERELAEFAPDVVSWWAMGGLSLSLIERVRRHGLPAVAFIHDDWLIYGPRVDGWLNPFKQRPRPVGALAERLTGVPTTLDVGASARCVFVSESTRRRAIESGVCLPVSSVAHSGIDTRFLVRAEPQPWKSRLLYVGRLDERKGVDTAIGALTHLPRATLTVVGGWDPHEERRLREETRRLGVGSRVHFEGQRSQEELFRSYAEADAVLFPVRWEEPWGLVPLEAMARGRPVIATGRGGSGEYLRDGVNCLLFGADDPVELARAVGSLAGDPGLRERLVAAGLETARQHTEAHFNAAVLRELEAAIDG